MKRFKLIFSASLYIVIVFTIAICQGCSPSSDNVEALVENAEFSVEDSLSEGSFQIALNPPKTDLAPGEQVILSASPFGTNREILNPDWSVSSVNSSTPMTQQLSAESGPSIVFTAPADISLRPLCISIIARLPEVEDIAEVHFTVADSESTVSDNALSVTETVSLVMDWDRIHHDSDNSLDPTELPLVLTGNALRGQMKTIQLLQESNCYWEFEDLRPAEVVESERVSACEYSILVNKHWNGELYCNDIRVESASITEAFFIRYQVIQTADGWRIADKQTVVLEETGQ